MENWGHNWIYFNFLHSPDRIDTYFRECFLYFEKISLLLQRLYSRMHKIPVEFCQKSVVYMCKSDVKYQISQKLLHFIPNTKETDILFCKEKELKVFLQNQKLATF